MKESKLLKLISSFDSDELKRLNAFVHSPYFNSGQQAHDLQNLFQLIYQAVPNFDATCLEKDAIYLQLYPDSEFVKGKLEKLMSRLLNLLMDFIALEYSDARQRESTKLLAHVRFFRTKKLSSQFEAGIKKLNKELSTRPFQDRNYFYDKLQMEEELVSFYGQQNTRAVDLNLPATLKQLDIYYLVSKLEYSIWLLSQNIHIPLDLEDSLLLLEKIGPLIEQESYLNIPVIRVYHQAFLLLHSHEEDNHKEFVQLRALMDEFHQEIDPQQVKALQTLLRIHAIGQYNRGKDHYLEEAFQLYSQHLDQGYLYHNGKLYPGTVRNLVVLGIRTSNLTWVQQFLDKHKNKITGANHPDEVYHFNLANYYFANHQYEEALDLLGDNYEDVYYKLAAKRLEIKVYFEQNSPLLEPRLEAFKVYIFRLSKKRLPEKQRIGNNHFIDILRQIINPKTLNNDDRIEKLRSRIQDKKIVAEKEWLLEKLK